MLLLIAVFGFTFPACDFTADSSQKTTVVNTDVISVTGVSLNKTVTSLEVGGTDQLTVTISPADATDQGITWSTSDGARATVSASGLVTAVAVGSAVITATTNDGGITATCTVTVTTAYVLPAFSMVSVPGKSFKTGVTDAGTASVTGAFSLGETEVTYELWYAVKSWAVANGYYFANQGKEGSAGTVGAAPTTAKTHPVTTVNWRDAMVWMNALTEFYNLKNGTNYTCVYYSDSSYTTPKRDSRDGAYGFSINTTAGSADNPYVKSDATGFRLPTSNEWELAARYVSDGNGDGDIFDAGEYYPGNYASGATAGYSDSTATGLVAVYGTTSTAAVKSKNSNALGIYDMSGNVFEWCSDWFTAQTTRVSRGELVPFGKQYAGWLFGR